MSDSTRNVWLHRFAVLTALASLCLVAVGGLVTSKEAGMSVPDWPNSYGYNMFLFPVSKWVGGIFYEHSHRLIASVVGLMVVALTRWIGGSRSRLPLMLIGLAELLGGFALLRFSPELKAAGYFLSGIGAVVLAAGVVWVTNSPAARPLPILAWIAFAAVQVQGLLGGLRVVLSANEIGIFHAALAQLFLALLCVIALLTSSWWNQRDKGGKRLAAIQDPITLSGEPEHLRGIRVVFSSPVLITVLIFIQLLLGATMRHQHAGLAIPDFPLAYGKLWPGTDRASIQLYNQQRLETVNVNPITAFQVTLQMAHRILAMIILVLVATITWKVVRTYGMRSPSGRLFMLWLWLVLLQISLGAASIWSNKAADIATAHVVVGALLLAAGALICLIAPRSAPAKNVLGLAALQGTAYAGQPLAASLKS